MHGLRRFLTCMGAALTAFILAAGAGAQQPTATPAPANAEAPAGELDARLQAQIRALARAQSAVVGLRSIAVEDAQSSRSLGRQRSGSGVLIDDDGGLVLTIGYLVLEAEQVDIELDDGRIFPGRVTAYDQASGFGLVQPLAPLPRPAVPLGQASTITLDDPLMIASGGRSGDLSLARLVSRRPFTGYWEYHIESALFTVPPRGDHSGAALFNADGELLGIGSLVVNDAGGPQRPALAGNMFVPVDLLRPILAELRDQGASANSRRAWLGLNCVEVDGAVRVARVTSDGPADAAGLKAGDQIVRIDGVPVAALDMLYKTLWRGESPDREVRLDIVRDGTAQTISVQATDRSHTFRRARGI